MPLHQYIIKNSLNHVITINFICSFTAFWLLLLANSNVMSGKVIVFFILSILLIIFTIQNELLINIRFFKWEMTDVPLVMVLIAGLIFGFLLAMMMQLPRIMRLKRQLKEVINELENDNAVADKDDDITSEGIRMGSDYKGGFFNE